MNEYSNPSRRPVIYDITRLMTRVLNDAPNGIDRIDLALARYFTCRNANTDYVLLWTIMGPKLFPASMARDIISDLERHWRELRDDGDDLYEAVVQRLLGPAAASSRIVRHANSTRLPFVSMLAKYVMRRGRSLRNNAPNGAAYINSSHFPLEYRAHINWLFERPDIQPIFFIHDMLPIESPQYFWKAEPDKHRRRLRHIRELRGRALVASGTVASNVRTHFERDGYLIPTLQLAPPISRIFYSHRKIDTRLAARPYFLVCATIEPRKNHVFLLLLWRSMADLSDDTPALVIVGKRGWNAQSVVGVLDRSNSVSRHVIEVSGLPTPALKKLMDNAVALLAPSFAEGFGLPLAEAAAVGLPVIAADIVPFREMPRSNHTLIDTLDGHGWLRAIQETLGRRQRPRVGLPPGPGFEEVIEGFLAA